MNKDIMRLVAVLLFGFFIAGWITVNYDYRAGTIYLALGAIAFLIIVNEVAVKKALR